MNKRSWLYRARPAVAHQGFSDLPDNPDTESNFLPINKRVHISPTQLAWLPFDIPSEGADFVDGLKTIAGSGDPTLREGIATHMYMANKNMDKKAFVNSDGDFLICPQQGALDIQTEFGMLFVQPGEICVLQRGQRYKVNLPDGPSRGYVLEIWGSNFELPELGPLGGNSLANARDFLTPTAKYEIVREKWEVVYKLGGKFFVSTQEHGPFDVVAWHGNYVPYKYDLTKFVNVGSISVDHIDPSIFCVLTAKSRDPAAPLADFLIFSPRWDVASHTYRPPYYHRNVASEFMGLLYGEYGGRSDEFQPGGASYECGSKSSPTLPLFSLPKTPYLTQQKHSGPPRRRLRRIQSRLRNRTSRNAHLRGRRGHHVRILAALHDHGFRLEQREEARARPQDVG